MEYTEAKARFIQSWGTLGSKWGINRTMAMVHALLLISSKPLCAEEIMEELNISRGNANMNLRALMDWGIVEKHLIPGERKEFFMAEKDVYKVAKRIAQERRKRELQPVLGVLQEVQNVKGKSADVTHFKEVIGDLKDLTDRTDRVLDKLAGSDENWFVNTVVKLMT